MKKVLFVCTLMLAIISINAQNYEQLNDLISKIEKRNKQNRDATDYIIEDKKYVFIQKFDDHDERHIIEFSPDKSFTLIELFDDHKTGKTASNVFTGDYVRKKNVVSVRADKLEGKKIGMPLTYTFYLMNAKKVWYLKDLNSDGRWIENTTLGKKK